MNYNDNASEREAKNDSPYWNDPSRQLIFWRIIAGVVTAVIYIAAIILFSK